MKKSIKINVEKCLSRLKTKNVVYKIWLDDKPYVIKIYLDEDYSRLKIEQMMYEYFSSHNIVAVPKYKVVNNFLLLEYLEGISFKKLSNKLLLKNIPIFYSLLEKVWKIEDIPLPTYQIGVDVRNHCSLEHIISTIKSYNLDIDIDYLIEKYHKLSIKCNFDDKMTVNSDISAHEIMIFNDKIYWIDFETFKKGDANIDLARSFYSITSSRDNEVKDSVFNIVTNNQYYKKDNFFYFLIEKILGNLYVSKGQEDMSSLKYYEQLIKSEYSRKTKKRSIN